MDAIGETGRRDATGVGAGMTWAVLLAAAVAVAGLAPGQELGSANEEARQRFSQGMDRMRALDWPGAAAEFAAATRLDPAFAEAHLRLGQVRLRMQLPTEARTCFEKALQLTPDVIEARLGLAYALVELKLNDRAESEARRILDLDESQPEAHIVLGEIAAQRAQAVEDPRQRMAAYDSAVEHLSRAVDLRGGNAEYRRALGLILFRAGRLREAADELRQAVKLSPNNALYHRELGQIYFYLNRYAEASAHLIVAHHRDEKQRDADLYILLMRSAYSLGFYQEAAHWAALAQRMSPQHAPVLLLSGTIHRYLGNHTLADQFVRQALLVEPKLSGADYELGMLSFDRGEWRAAVEFLRRATENDPDDYRGWYQLGLTYRRLEQTPESDRALARFRELKDAEQAEKERLGIEAGPADRPIITDQPTKGTGVRE